MILNSYLNDKDNNFNLLRFIAASLVLYAHSYPLLFGEKVSDPFKNLIGMHLGEVAVDIFFITSSFLIANSFFYKKSIISFLWARFLRIYPALFVAILFSILLGLYFTDYSFYNYTFNIDTFKYFLKNIILFFGVEYYLPGVFSDNPYSPAVNGSLWTLPWEVKMYVYLLIIGLIVLFFNKKFNTNITRTIFSFIGISSILLYIFNHFEHILNDNFIRLFCFFFSGVMYYILSKNIMINLKIFLFFLSLLIISVINSELFFILYVITLPYIIFSIVYLIKGQILKFNLIGDYSYGIYIYAFPVQQSIVALFPNISLIYMILSSFLITLFLAVISWHIIEKNALKLKKIKFQLGSKCK